MSTKGNKQHGGVSLFIVIFTTLIITIITVSFTQLMVRNQQQASENDLAQRAYDSALAGVEDAKRLLVMYQNCNTGPTNNCSLYKTSIDDQKCDTIQSSHIVSTAISNDKEVQVGEEADNQAYTCVKIDTKSPNFEGFLEKDTSAVIPLIGKADFTKVRISWFTAEDSPSPSISRDVNMPLPAQNSPSWGSATPPIMRAQYIPQVAPDQLDTEAKTLFLYPLNAGGNLEFATDLRRDNSKSPSAVGCTSGGTGGACSVSIKLPAKPASGVAYLQLMALYNKAHFTVELLNDTDNVVYFDNVQPVVDSTGRAENLFRRVKARVKLGGIPLSYPDGAINVRGPLCKTFFVTNDPADFKPNGCTP